MRVWPAKRPPRANSRPRPAPVPAASNRWPVQTPTRAWYRRVPARPSGLSRKATAPAVGGLFFPQSRSLGIDQSEASPMVLQQLTYAGIACRSFAEAHDLVTHLTELEV